MLKNRKEAINGDYSLLSKVLFLLIIILAATSVALLSLKTIDLIKYIISQKYSFWIIGALIFCARIFHSIYKRNNSPQKFKDPIALQNIANTLCSKMKISPIRVLISDNEGDARIDFSRKTAYLIAPPSFDFVARINPQSIYPIIIHELAHIANGDAKAAKFGHFSIKITLIFFGVVALTDFLAYIDGLRVFSSTYGIDKIGWPETLRIFQAFFWIIPFIAILLLSEAAFLRMREFEADRIVAQFGYGKEMCQALLEAKISKRNFLRMHPTPQQRAKSLQEQTSIHTVEHQTIGIGSAIFCLLMSSTSQISGGYLYVLSFAASAILCMLVLTLLGISFGRRMKIEEHSPTVKFTELGKSLIAISAGVIITTTIDELISSLSIEAPIHLQIWEALFSSLSVTTGISIAFFASYLIGAVTAKALLPTGAIRYFWVILSTCLALPLFNLTASAVHMIFSPYEIGFGAHFFANTESIHAKISEIIPNTPPLSRLHISPTGIATGAISLIISAYIGLFLTTKLIEIVISYTNRDVVQKIITKSLFLIVAIFGTIIPPTIIVTALFPIGKEIRMISTLWISCSTKETNIKSEEAYTLTKEVLSRIDKIKASTPIGPGSFIGMLENKCDSHAMERYPVIRFILSKITNIEDIFVDISFTNNFIYIETQNGFSEIPEKITLPHGQSTDDLAQAIIFKHFPYTLARNNPSIPSKYQSLALSEAITHRHASQRAWAHHEYAMANFDSNPELAEEHLKKSIELQPSTGTFRSTYAHLLTFQSRCEEARPHVAYAASRGSLSGLATLAYGRCLHNIGKSNEAFDELWRMNSYLKNDANFAAALGEIAIWAGKYRIAREQVAIAASKSKNKNPFGCARLFNEYFKNIKICNQDSCSPPIPEQLMTTQEKQCWTVYAHRFGHKFTPH